METEITIRNLQNQIPLNPNQIIRAVRKILRHEGIKKACLSIVFVTDRKIRALNRRFLKRNHATDVLAFDLTRDVSSALRRIKVKYIEGEIIVSTDTVLRNAKIYEVKPKQELILCVVHGILHLLGYDDHSRNNIKRMRKKEQELLHLLAR